MIGLPRNLRAMMMNSRAINSPSSDNRNQAVFQRSDETQGDRILVILKQVI